ncbi:MULTISPECIES: GMC oxidoreductase [unclassified Mycobacterium]|uniref:GMC oxidoreductase n=1 Tax=unclassified Mycobacterium TaxID=2642494 RepID=UPI0006DC55D2|nr:MULTISPECIES: GMC oxidoreductase [unclassified Mycobacterium]
MTDESVLEADVLVVGSGPIGATFARTLVEAGRKVIVIDAGAQHSARPGEHLKNAFVYQRDLDRFTPIVQGLLNPVSVAPVGARRTVIDPLSFRAGRSIRSAHNPRQDPDKNLEAAAVSYGVGGMFTHWTNNTPRQHPTMERLDFIDDAEWDVLYGSAEALLNTNSDVFDGSVRHAAVIDALSKHYPGLPKGFGPQSLPTAGERSTVNDEFVHFTGTDTILGPLADDPNAHGAGRFRILEQHRCTTLVHKNGRVDHAVVEDLIRWRTLRIHVDLVVVAGGAVLTPQLLWASGVRPTALGRYLTEHPMAFTQVVLREDLVQSLWSRLSAEQRDALEAEKDPVPIPMHDPPPMVWIPVSDGRPWHCQIHRDSFQYGALPPDIDDRLVVDLRWFGMVEPNVNNRVWFEDDLRDKFGMPRPTFEFTLGDADRRRAHAMMSDMLEAAQALGGFLVGAEPRFLPPGSSLHLEGTSRMGPKDDDTSVVDPYSRVWGFDNLYLGGNGLLPTANACNPTLTSVALAIRAVHHIIGTPVPAPPS